MIDEYPILAVAAACARGRTVMRGLAELRVKESDRLAGDRRRASPRCGVEVRVEGDDLIVEGNGGPPPGGAAIATGSTTASRWRFSCSGWPRAEPVRIDDAAPIATSFPGFRGADRPPRRATSPSADEPSARRAGQFVVAIDGPAASGKGTLGAASRRALRLGLSRHRGALSRDRLSGAAGAGRPGRTRNLRQRQRAGSGRDCSPIRGCAPTQ